MAVVQTRLYIIAAATALIVHVAAKHTLNCTVGFYGNEYIADDADLCVYYHCRNGLPTDEWPAACAKGTRLPSYYNRTDNNPCTEIVSRSVCLRCDINDVQRKPDVVTDYCTLWTPCDAGCICHNQIEGYWCDCNGPLSTLPALPTYSHQCNNSGYCLNGGTCYKLYDADPFCDCVPGWTGKRCDSKLCDWNPCMHNGTCVLNGTSIHCQCDTCWKGSCCETLRTEDPDCIGCGKCQGGLNCTGNRDWLCECNPCPAGLICAAAGLNEVRFCDPGAATAGTRFTLMFQENFEPDTNESPKKALELYIAAGEEDNQPRTVNVSAPGAAEGCRFSITKIIAPSTVGKVDVPAACRHDSTGRENKGILVQEINNKRVTVFGINRAANSSDSFLAIPDSRAGKAFVTVCYPTKRNQANDHSTQFGIVATAENTTVNITLSTSSDIIGSVQDETYIVTLRAFQTYQVQSKKPGADLSGTIITSSQPIHVVSGNVRTSVLVNRNSSKTLSSDHLVEEIPPADTWGKTFAIVPIPRDVLGYERTLELIRLVASFDTDCTLYSSTEEKKYSIFTKTDWFIEFFLDASDNYFLDCTDPVLIMEITESANESITDSSKLFNDPAMIYIPAVAQYTNYYVFAPPTYSQTGGPYGTTLVVLAANSTVYQQIQVNNVLTSALRQFKPWRRIAPSLPASNTADSPPLYGGIFNVPNVGTSVIRHPILEVPFMCIIYCYDNRESVGHVAGSKLSKTNSLSGGNGLSQWQYAMMQPYHFIN